MASKSELTVQIMASRGYEHPELMHLLQCVFLIEAKMGFSLYVTHIAGIANDLVDELPQ